MYSSIMDVEDRTKLLDQLCFPDDSGVAEILANAKPTQRPEGGRPEINRYDFLATVIFGFAFGSWTLRELETACKFDIRYQYLMRGVQPTYASFGIFINEYILPNTEEIFSCLMR